MGPLRVTESSSPSSKPWLFVIRSFPCRFSMRYCHSLSFSLHLHNEDAPFHQSINYIISCVIFLLLYLLFSFIFHRCCWDTWQHWPSSTTSKVYLPLFTVEGGHALVQSMPHVSTHFFLFLLLWVFSSSSSCTCTITRTEQASIWQRFNDCLIWIMLLTDIIETVWLSLTLVMNKPIIGVLLQAAHGQQLPVIHWK